MQCCGQFPSTGTLRYLLRLLRAVLQVAVDDDVLSRNVAKQVKMPIGVVRKVKSWTAAEARQFLAEAEKDRLHALWAVALLGLGPRRGEALGLRWADIDFAAGRIDIVQTLQRLGGTDVFVPPKTDSSESWVPMTDDMARLLRQRQRDQRSDPREATGNKHGLGFTTRNGTPLSACNVNRAFERMCLRAGVRPIRLHDLRHSCATLLFSQGVDPAVVSRILRHSSITITTDIYTEVIESVRRDALAGMDELLRRRETGA